MTTRTLPLLAMLTLTITGCAGVRYDHAIRPGEGLARLDGAPRRLAVDLRASYLEVTSDGAAPARAALPTERYDRYDIAHAVEDAWAGSFGTPGAPATPARIYVRGRIEHQASETAAEVLHSLTGGVALLFGAPAACARANVVLAVQTGTGVTWVGRASTRRCAGLYAPADHRASAFAAGVSEALGSLRPVAAGELDAQIPTLREVPALSRGASPAVDRLVWSVQPTRDFPTVWGDDPVAGS